MTLVCSPDAPPAPVRAGTCCRKMIVAIPRVNPSMTGHGMNETARPSRAMPARTTRTPAMSVTTATAPTPCVATIGRQDDDHGPGRSGHLDVGAAEHRRDQPGDDRGDEPGLGSGTGRDAEAERQGERDDADGEPGEQVAAPRARQLGVVGRGSAAGVGPARAAPSSRHGRGEARDVVEPAAVAGAHDVHEQPASDGEQLGDLGVREPVVDVARAPVGLDETVAAKDGEVLGQVGRLEAGLLLELGDGVLLAVGEEFEEPDAQRVREAFEQPALTS